MIYEESHGVRRKWASDPRLAIAGAITTTITTTTTTTTTLCAGV